MPAFQTFKALSFRTFSGSLQVVEHDVKSIHKDNHILIRVHAASINPVDAQLWHSPLVGVVTGEKGLGRDFSGTIVEVGSQVKGNWAAGDDVFGLHFEIVWFVLELKYSFFLHENSSVKELSVNTSVSIQLPIRSSRNLRV